MRRPQELVDRRHAIHACSRHRSGCAGRAPASPDCRRPRRPAARRSGRSAWPGPRRRRAAGRRPARRSCVQLLEGQRPAEEVAPLAGHALQPGGVAIRPVECRKRRPRRPPPHAPRDLRPAAARRCRSRKTGRRPSWRARRCAPTSAGHRLLGGFGRLQEAAGRHGDRQRRRTSPSAFAARRRSRRRRDSRAKPCADREMRGGAARALGQLAAVACGDVEAGGGRGDGDAEGGAASRRSARRAARSVSSAATISGSRIGHSSMSTISADSALL